MSNIPQTLTIAGSDSGGGAGIQADLKTFQMQGVFGTSVITAVTAQNTLGVFDIHPIPLKTIQAQLEAVKNDFQIASAKIGMLGTADIIECVADFLKNRPFGTLVIDPVMIAKGGAPLLQHQAVSALSKYLLPLADVITPNIPVELFFGIIYSFILNWKINQVYPWLKSNVALGKELFKKYPEVTKYTKQLFMHRLGSFFQFQVTPFLVYAFVSLQMAAYFGNYSTVVEKLHLLVNNLLGSTEASVGNLIAEGNAGKIRKVFSELFSLRMLIAGTVCFPLYQLLEPFITLWLGAGYILPREIMLLLVIRLFITITRGVVDQFLYGYGLFWDVWAPLAESVINISVAIIGGYLWGLPGVLLGGISSLILIVGIWKPFMLYNWGFRKNVMNYWFQFGYQLALILISAVFMGWIWKFVPLQPSASFFSWFLCAFLMAVSYGGVTVLLMYCGTQGMRGMVRRALEMAGTRLPWRKKTE